MPRRINHELLVKPSISGNIGERLQAVRINRNITQKELADKIGIKRHMIADYESGRRKIYSEMLTAICLVLIIPPDELLGLQPLKNIDKNTTRKRIRHTK